MHDVNHNQTVHKNSKKRSQTVLHHVIICLGAFWHTWQEVASATNKMLYTKKTLRTPTCLWLYKIGRMMNKIYCYACHKQISTNTTNKHQKLHFQQNMAYSRKTKRMPCSPLHPQGIMLPTKRCNFATPTSGGSIFKCYMGSRHNIDNYAWGRRFPLKPLALQSTSWLFTICVSY